MNQKKRSKYYKEDGYSDLANAIILQAVKDYRDALKKLHKRRKNEVAEQSKNQVERFFYSEWFIALTEIDPRMLMQRLNEEVAK